MALLGSDSISCYCRFYLRYKLPCQHILHSDYLYNILDLKHWETYACNFEGDAGMEIYEGEAEIEVLKEPKEPDGLANRKLKMKEIYQHLSTRFFELEETLEKEEGNVRDACMERWLYGLSSATDPFIKNSILELLRA